MKTESLHTSFAPKRLVLCSESSNLIQSGPSRSMRAISARTQPGSIFEMTGATPSRKARSPTVALGAKIVAGAFMTRAICAGNKPCGSGP